MIKLAWSVLLVLSALWSGARAHAQSVPLACSAARDASGYQAGFLAGKSLVKQAWAAVYDCDRIEEVEAAVRTALQRSLPASSSTRYLQCRFAGMAAGAVARVDGLFTKCADACFFEGQVVGEITAIAYCELSILLGGLGISDLFVRGPVQACGLSFEVACDTNFETTAISYANLFGQQCLRYTRSPFLAVFQQTRDNQCAYNPIPPDEDG